MELLTVLESKQVVNDFLNEWFSVYPAYGREIWSENDRVFIHSPRAFVEYVETCKKLNAPCWLSVQPFSDRNKVRTVEKLFFDFDSHNKALAWKEAQSFALTLKNCYSVEPLLCFSGKKGYHVYVWLSEIQTFNNEGEAKRFYSTAQSLLLKGLKFETCDRQVLGDIKRLSRVPYSIHNETFYPCSPITIEHVPCLAFSLEGYRKHGLNVNFIELCHKQTEKTDHKVFRASKQRIEKGIRPSLQAALNMNLEDGDGHNIRIAIASEYLNNGYSPEQTAELFQNQTDYSFEKSLHYVRDIAARNYKPFKCATIRALGFCLPDCKRRIGK